jgi:hypothetical protein
MAAAPRKPPSNVGCVIAIVALPFVVLLGIVIGTVLRSDDDDAEELHIELERGELEGVAWQVDAVRDVDGQTCVFLYEEGAGEPLNGTCDLQPQDVTYGDQTVVFGRAEAGDRAVTVELEDGEEVEVDTRTVGDLDGSFYVTIVDADVDVEALAG